ncbi:MAG TPA: family 43 glycosylhydrolase [Candidatus Hydrogenedentes bacterium]|nr:family 43 glycosylhydrolase [Candidatus Hydrogenedentota bacterium]
MNRVMRRYGLSCCIVAVCLMAADGADVAAPEGQAAARPEMDFTDRDYGGAFAKDPDVVKFGGRYLLYYSTRLADRRFAVGIAESRDLVAWTKVGEVRPDARYDRRGLAAPAALVHEGRVHLFYQTYGQGRLDAICHAVSEDGVRFERNPTNPIFRPMGDWNAGRAIDAEVFLDGETALLYCATRDPDMKRQMLVVATAPTAAGFVRESWTQRCDAAILAPELPWETACVEAPAVLKRDGRFYMFYAGGYNNNPQQIGVAVSDDGLSWKRVSDQPLLPNGLPESWNHSESGHPGVFTDDDGAQYLFFQGNDDNGATWYLSKMRLRWRDGLPYLVRPGDGHEFHLSLP